MHRSVDNIIGEFKALMKRGIRYFRFEDDNVAIHPEFPYLANEIQKFHISYKCHIRSDLVNEERAWLLAESGCEECGIGLESADDNVLKLNNKKETSFDHLHALRVLQKAGIRTKTYFVMGLPGETDETLKLNKQFVQEARPDKWTVSTFTPYPGCDIYKHPENYGIKIVDWDFAHWWNFCEEMHQYNHIIIGQTPEQMWNRYKNFYNFMAEGSWQA